MTPPCTKNSPNSANINCIFSVKEREDSVLILAYLDSLMVIKGFPGTYVFFFDFGHLQGLTGFKVEPKVQTLGPSRFPVNSDFQKVP